MVQIHWTEISREKKSTTRRKNDDDGDNDNTSEIYYLAKKINHEIYNCIFQTSGQTELKLESRTFQCCRFKSIGLKLPGEKSTRRRKKERKMMIIETMIKIMKFIT